MHAFEFGTVSGGIERRIRDGHDGIGLREKGFDQRVEFGHPLRIPLREVDLLAGIIVQIEEQVAVRAVHARMEQPDELPAVTPMGGDTRRQPIGHAGVVGEILEDRLPIDRAAFECGQDADTIAGAARRGRQGETFQQRGQEVLALGEGIAAGTRRGDAGPGDDLRHAGAPFEHAGLAAAQGSVAGGCRSIHFVIHVATIVGGENDDGLVGQTEAVQRVEQGADGIVERLDHGGVGGAALGIGRIDERAVFCDEFLLRIKWGVDAELPVVEEKRSILILFHPRHGLGGHAVLDVLARGVGLEIGVSPRSDEGSRRAGARPMGEIHVEAVFQRGIRGWSEMPFAEVAGGISGGLEDLRQGWVSGLQTGDRNGLDGVLVGRGGLARRGLQADERQVAIRRGDAGARRAETGEDRGARRRTKRTRGIGAGEGHAKFCQAFEIGGPVELGVAMERRIRPTEVIGENEEDVGFALVGTVRQGSTDERQRDEDGFHGV